MKIKFTLVGGYFTVEAALVLPVTFGVVLLVIYLLFFQYNRALMEMDIGALALQGSCLQAENNEERIGKLRKIADVLSQEKYIAWNWGEIGLKLEKEILQVKQEGMLKFPFSGSLRDDDGIWEVETHYENHVLSPVSFIRKYRKLAGG